jgi:hypothetical protein
MKIERRRRVWALALLLLGAWVPAWTFGPVDRASSTRGEVTNIRTGRHAGYDRVVFDLSGYAMTEYHVRYIAQAAECGSGNTVNTGNQRLLEVHFPQAEAHSAPTLLTPNYPQVKVVRTICDFEGHVNVFLGLAGHKRFRVQERHNPLRLVVDVQH